MKINRIIYSIYIFLIYLITSCQADTTKTFAGALAQGKSQQKWVFIYFISANCKPCHRLESETFTNKEIIDSLSRFIVLRVDAYSESGKICLQIAKEKAPQLKSFPCYIIMNPYNRNVKRYGNGFKSPIEFQSWLTSK